MQKEMPNILKGMSEQELIATGEIVLCVLAFIYIIYKVFDRNKGKIAEWRKARVKRKSDVARLNELFTKHTIIHNRFDEIKAACIKADEERKAREEKWLAEQKELLTIVAENEKKEKAKRTRANNVRKFEKLFGFRPAMLKRRENGGHIAYWQDVQVRLARLAGQIFNEQRRALRRFPSKDDCTELTIEYENARLLVRRYCRELYDETRPWSEQLRLLAPPPARPARERGRLLAEKSSVPDVTINGKKRNGRRQPKAVSTSETSDDGIIDAVIVSEPKTPRKARK